MVTEKYQTIPNQEKLLQKIFGNVVTTEPGVLGQSKLEPRPLTEFYGHGNREWQIGSADNGWMGSEDIMPKLEENLTTSSKK